MDLFPEEALIRCASVAPAEVFGHDVRDMFHQPCHQRMLGRNAVAQLVLQGEDVHPQEAFYESHSVLDCTVALRLVRLRLLLQGLHPELLGHELAHCQNCCLVVHLQKHLLLVAESSNARRGSLGDSPFVENGALGWGDPSLERFALAFLQHHHRDGLFFVLASDIAVVHNNFWDAVVAALHCFVRRVVAAACYTVFAPGAIREVVRSVGSPFSCCGSCWAP